MCSELNLVSVYIQYICIILYTSLKLVCYNYLMTVSSFFLTTGLFVLSLILAPDVSDGVWKLPIHQHDGGTMNLG